MNKKNETMYVQCKLTYGNKMTTAWIPKIFAKVGKCIELIKDNSTWFVNKTYGEMSYKDLKDKSDAHRHHREATDI